MSEFTYENGPSQNPFSGQLIASAEPLLRIRELPI